jgi:hypothetical protein
LYLAVAAMIGSQMACGSSDDTDWEEVTVQEPSKGVVTMIRENADGSFVIEDEQVVASKADSRIIVNRLNGDIDTMTVEQARSLVQATDTLPPQTTVTQHHYHHGSGLGNVIWWGAMGYMMGRSLSTPVQSYVYRQDEDRKNGGGSSFARGGYYAGNRAASELKQTAVNRTQMRPVKGRSGFFRGWGRSSGG